jgi:spore germination protein YaaH
MKKRTLHSLAIFLLLWGLIGPVVESAYLSSQPLLSRPITASINAWVANFHPGAASAALSSYTKHVKEISIFGVGGNLKGPKLAVETPFIESSLKMIKRQKRSPRILLTIANLTRNNTGNRRLIKEWIGSEEARKRHIKDLLKLAEKVDGLDIDYENLQPKDGPKYTFFISQLAQALHARGKYLSVTVEPNLLLYGSIDWSDLGSRVDRVRVMAYPFHYERTSPGSLAPPQTVRRLALRGLKDIPADKLEIALAIYGFDWGPQGTRLVPTMQQYERLMKRPGARAFRDPSTGAARIEYSVAEGRGRFPHQVAHHVWFEDPTAVAFKVQMLQQMGIKHIGIWQLGVGDISELFIHVKATAASAPQIANLRK